MRETLLTRGGEIVNERVREFLSLPALAAAGKEANDGAVGLDDRIFTYSCWRRLSGLK